MARRPALPGIGAIVEMTQGRDRGAFGIVIGHVDSRFVWIADGIRRKADSPKRKNALHVRSTSQNASEVIGALQTGEKVSNALLRRVIKSFLRELGQRAVDVGQEGGVPHGEG